MRSKVPATPCRRAARLVNVESSIYDEKPRGMFGRNAMNGPCMMVCERSGKWAVALAPHLAPTIRLRQTRSLVECSAVLAQAPASLLAVEATRENLAGVLALLVDVAKKFSQARAIVLADRGLESYEWLLREAGAVHFTVSPRESHDLALLARRHLEHAGAARADLAAQIWDALPWSDVA